MGYLDDLPERHESHDLADASEAAFEAAIRDQEFFLIQRKDKYDYGTDFQLEARDCKSMTNLRVHVQLKGTGVAARKDGSIGISVSRANLNYLISQPESIYVCWHAPSSRLLARYVSEVFGDYQHRGSKWQKAKKLTVDFLEPFDEVFQSRLHARVLAVGRSVRDQRLSWAATPPEGFPTKVKTIVPLVEVPANPKRAFEVLENLYNAGQDDVISQSFTRFDAVLKNVEGAMVSAYLAEINLGINGLSFDRKRVSRAIEVVQKALDCKKTVPISGLYCQGNAWLALGEHEKARSCYLSALKMTLDDTYSDIAAQCFKNLGSVTEALGDHQEALRFFELALKHDPYLPEAHMAVAVCGLKNGRDPKEALEHLDAITAHERSAVSIPSVQGWRIQILFELGDVKEAFREIQALTAVANNHEWIWPHCARQVASFGRLSSDAARQSINFWQGYLRAHSEDPRGERERLLCFSYLNFTGVQTEMTSENFRSAVERLIEKGGADAALLWDRAGHWAQNEGDWGNAEACFRKAYDLAGGHYGYCLGVALNFLRRYSEALPFLLTQANEFQPDAMSWFQVAIARENTGDIDGCVSAYERAIELDPQYELAWFNLGGIHLNRKDFQSARAIWNNALIRFPEHVLATQIKRDYATLLRNRPPK